MRSDKSRNRETIIRLLQEKGPLSTVEIAEEIGLHQFTVQKHLKELLENGILWRLVKHGGRVEYKLRPIELYDGTITIHLREPMSMDRISDTIKKVRGIGRISLDLMPVKKIKQESEEDV